MDASASVFYGVVLDHDENLDDEVYEAHGIDPDVWDPEVELIQKLGLGDDITVYKGGYDLCRKGFYTQRVLWVYDYGEGTLDPSLLVVTPQETEKLKQFCEAAGITDQEPRWIVTADYS